MQGTGIAGQALSPEETAKKLQEKYDATQSLTADFEQISSSDYIDRKKQGKGMVMIKKPGFIRWDYRLPDKQVFVSDGQSLSMYFEKSRQMMRGSAEQYLQSDVTYSFFTGKGNILKDFDVHPPSYGIQIPDSVYCIKLIPKNPHPQIDFLHAWIKSEDFTIMRMQIIDHLGSMTDLHFSNIKLNPDIPKEEFSFTPPEGTEIIEQ